MFGHKLRPLQTVHPIHPLGGPRACMCVEGEGLRISYEEAEALGVD